MKYMCTKFGVAHSRHFSFTAQTQTDKVTDATDHPPVGSYHLW